MHRVLLNIPVVHVWMIDLHTLLMNNFEHRVFSIEPINNAVHNRCIKLGWSVEKNGALYGARFAPR